MELSSIFKHFSNLIKMNYLNIVWTIILISLVGHTYSDNNNETSESTTTERILSRKKRHLIFPEGSSVQLAFDYLIPTYGVPKIFVIGMSLALAWELPSEPYRSYHVGRPAERPEGSMEGSKENEEGQKEETASNDVMNDKYYAGGWNKVGSNWGPNWQNDRKDTRRPLVNMKWPYTKNVYNKYTPANNYNYYSEKYNRPYYPYQQPMREQRPMMRPQRPKHRIYPVFTKRSIKDDVELQHHRKTRRDLYTKIARMFSSQGKNGQECVLKSLCEAGKRRSEGPGEFLEEILKAIFTMPNYGDLREKSEYDEAHYTEEDCSVKYPKCSNSIFHDDIHKFAMK